MEHPLSVQYDQDRLAVHTASGRGQVVREVIALASSTTKPKVHVRYPLSGLLIYNGSTTLHYLLGGAGIMVGYSSLAGYVVGGVYLVFAFVQMYVVMPLAVCPNCVYYRLKGALCVSGMNVVSRNVAGEGDLKAFGNRAEGLLCHNNLYMAALVIPIVAMIPALVMSFSFPLLALFLSVLAMLLFRMFVLFPRIACVHCSAKHECPNARSMGLGGN